MGTLITIILAAVVARLWLRLDAVQRRLNELENLPFARLETEPLDESWAPAAGAEVGPDPNCHAEPDAVAEFALVPPESIVEDDVAAEPAAHGDVPARKFGFEDIFGRRLPIWAGGITLAVAGMLIVKYSIDAGLVAPVVRVLSGLIFGTALIGAAELALRAEARVRDPRVRQALSGAGLASLYGAILIAANVYSLVGPLTAFIGMAAVTALAMGLSLRFGAPSALLGLAGGLAAPALVGSGEPNIPLLASYLALAVGGLTVLSRSQRWMWLGVAALTGGFGWAAVMLLTGILDSVASVSLAIYILLLGIVLPTFAFSGKLSNSVRLAGSIAAAAQIAALVAIGGFTLLNWSIFGLISAAILWLASRDRSLASLPALGLVIAILLLLAWPDPTAGQLAIVMLAGAVLYGAPAMHTLWRPVGSVMEAAQLAAIGLASLAVPMAHFFEAWSSEPQLALVGLVAAMVPASAAAAGWNSPVRGREACFPVLVTSAAVLVSASAALALPLWSIGPMIALVGLALLALSLRADDVRVETSAWAFAAGGVLCLTLGFQAAQEIGRLLGVFSEIEVFIALVRWGSVGAIVALFAWRARFGMGRKVAQAMAALIAYGAFAQMLDGHMLAVACALGVTAMVLWSRRLESDRLLAATMTILLVSLGWAAAPLLTWLLTATASLVGSPLLVTSLPNVQDTSLLLLCPAMLIAGAWWFSADHLHPRARIAMLASAAVMIAVSGHVLFKQLWTIDTALEFVRLGLVERICWEVLLLAAAGAAWRSGQSRIAVGLAVAGLAHFGWYTMILHNPLISEQAVGTIPLANLLLLAYGLPLLSLWVLGRVQPVTTATLDRIRSAAPMLLISLLVFSALRQLFQGSILVDPGVTPAEDIFRSVAAILLAIGFLLWGIRHGLRDWRIASLAIMIAAVAKVFLLDASGLDGLLRIASFIALGVSLIGIGWLYSHFLSSDRAVAPAR